MQHRCAAGFMDDGAALKAKGCGCSIMSGRYTGGVLCIVRRYVMGASVVRSSGNYYLL